MPKTTLTISSKNYSSWSLRGWLLAKFAGLEFEEVMVATDDADARAEILLLAPSILVPCLRHQGVKVWDTLAIAEYLAEYADEHFPEHALWPRDQAARARARSLCAEMHAGFGALRQACPMNIEALLPEVGARVLAEQPAVAADLARIVGMWSDALAASGGPFLFGGFTIADAYYAPVVARLRSYALPVPPALGGYVDRVWASPGVAAWVKGALAEQDFLAFEEPYRQHR